MSTPRLIRAARRQVGWPLGHQDPDEEDDLDFAAEDDFSEPEPIEADAYSADAAEDRWTAGRDMVASQ